METVTEATADERRPLAELETEHADIQTQIQELHSQYVGQRFPDDAKAQWNELHARRDDLKATIDELTLREADIAEQLQAGAVESTVDAFQTRRPGSVTGNDIYDLASVRREFNDPTVEGAQLRDRAMKALDTTKIPVPRDLAKLGATSARLKTNVEQLIERDAEDGRFSRYLLATGNPVYKRAFPKMLSPNGMMLLTRDEAASVQHVQAAERALNMTGANGGFAVPFELDPTIINTSNGVVNPIRQISRVENITVDEWRGISSAGVTASFAAEATETTDNAPTLAQPTVSTEKAQAFIPYSIEVGQDWGGLRDAMADLLQDAKDTLEAGKFVTGTGTNEPFGVAVGATNTVTAAAGGAFTLANLYALIQALPPRYRARASWIGDLIVLNKVRQFETTGGSVSGVWVEGLAAETPGADGRAGNLLGKPAYEASEMPDVTTVGVKFLIVGDFSRYLIADRIGLNLELIPHLMGANRRPTGERGIYAYWRVGAKVLDANAFRALLGAA